MFIVGAVFEKTYTGILFILSSSMLENKPINIFENGEESRDFINVVDVATGVISSIGNEKK